jgi:hypothetical protein
MKSKCAVQTLSDLNEQAPQEHLTVDTHMKCLKHRHMRQIQETWQRPKCEPGDL